MAANVHSREAEHKRKPSVHAHTHKRVRVKLQGLPEGHWQPLRATVDIVTVMDKCGHVTATAKGRELPDSAHNHM